MSFDLKPEASDADDLPEDLAPAEPAATGELGEPSGPPQTVSIAKPLSRRAAAAKEINDKLEGLTKTVSTLTEGLSQRDQALAQMRGFMEAQAMRPQQQYNAPQQQQPMPDHLDLAKQARKALDEKRFDDFHELTIAAAEAKTMARLAPALQDLHQRSQQASNPMPPELGAMFSAYPDVAMHPRHVDFLQAKNLELNARGIPPGPERLRMVFAEVDASLKGAKKNGSGAQYSQASASVLSGMPTSRSGGGGSGGNGGPGIALNAMEQKIAADLERKGLMTKEAYARGLAEADPSRISQ